MVGKIVLSSPCLGRQICSRNCISLANIGSNANCWKTVISNRWYRNCTKRTQFRLSKLCAARNYVRVPSYDLTYFHKGFSAKSQESRLQSKISIYKGAPNKNSSGVSVVKRSVERMAAARSSHGDEAICQNYDYLLILDFEATCDNEQRLSPQVGSLKN